jgi:2-C-methyl-D-erythritol 4-phosphate cytidylyltransferase/2-C-methyl-D-erythritol 2,4-cyclodiphosphate synthase
MKAEGKTVALLVAAGSGNRAGGGLPKQYRGIAGRPMLVHAIEGLRHPAIDEVVVVIAPGQEALFAEATAGLALPPPVSGGAQRQESVRNGLEAIAASEGAATVLIHDAARPFLPGAVIERLLMALHDAEGAVPALAVVDTLARREERLGETVNRGRLVRVQTPQAFAFEPILAAHRAWPGGTATDDAQIARAAGMEVALVEGDSILDKLTYEDDFRRAEERLRARLIACTGLGFDVHAFAPGDGVWMGGIRIPYSRALAGHSDADVVLHALTDAILGAIGAGDIGEHFPPSDPQWRGAASWQFVEHARKLAEDSGGRIDHVDVTIICEAPKIGPHRAAMRERIAGLLRLPVRRVSIKATTTERLGFTGRGEGIAAQAVATISMPEQP